jgi:hypothetical protein
VQADVAPAYIRSVAVLAFLLTQACGADSATRPQPAALRVVVPPSAAQTMRALPVQPQIELVDAGGNAVAAEGIAITATVISGDGQVVAGGIAQTGADGRATFQQLTLGAFNGRAGPATLEFATAAGLRVTSPVELACAIESPALGENISAALVEGDCFNTRGFRRKNYSFVIAAPTKAIRIRMVSDAFTPAATVHAANDRPGTFFGWSSLVNEVRFYALGPAGPVEVMASTSTPSGAGPFTLQVSEAPEDPGTCEDVQFHSPVNTRQTFTGSCTDDQGNEGDIFYFALSSGERVDVTLTSSAFTIIGAIYELGASAPATSATATGNSVSLTLTNSGDRKAFYVLVGLSSGRVPGEYTLAATITPAASGASARGNEPSTEVLALPRRRIGRGRSSG